MILESEMGGAKNHAGIGSKQFDRQLSGQVFVTIIITTTIIIIIVGRCQHHSNILSTECRNPPRADREVVTHLATGEKSQLFVILKVLSKIICYMFYNVHIEWVICF